MHIRNLIFAAAMACCVTSVLGCSNKTVKSPDSNSSKIVPSDNSLLAYVPEDAFFVLATHHTDNDQKEVINAFIDRAFEIYEVEVNDSIQNGTLREVNTIIQSNRDEIEEAECYINSDVEFENARYDKKEAEVAKKTSEANIAAAENFLKKCWSNPSYEAAQELVKVVDCSVPENADSCACEYHSVLSSQYDEEYINEHINVLKSDMKFYEIERQVKDFASGSSDVNLGIDSNNLELVLYVMDESNVSLLIRVDDEEAFKEGFKGIHDEDEDQNVITSRNDNQKSWFYISEESDDDYFALGVNNGIGALFMASSIDSINDDVLNKAAQPSKLLNMCHEDTVLSAAISYKNYVSMDLNSDEKIKENDASWFSDYASVEEQSKYYEINCKDLPDDAECAYDAEGMNKIGWTSFGDQVCRDEIKELSKDFPDVVAELGFSKNKNVSLHMKMTTDSDLFSLFENTLSKHPVYGSDNDIAALSLGINLDKVFKIINDRYFNKNYNCKQIQTLFNEGESFRDMIREEDESRQELSLFNFVLNDFPSDNSELIFYGQIVDYSVDMLVGLMKMFLGFSAVKGTPVELEDGINMLWTDGRIIVASPHHDLTKFDSIKNSESDNLFDLNIRREFLKQFDPTMETILNVVDHDVQMSSTFENNAFTIDIKTVDFPEHKSEFKPYKGAKTDSSDEEKEVEKSEEFTKS